MLELFSLQATAVDRCAMKDLSATWLKVKSCYCQTGYNDVRLRHIWSQTHLVPHNWSPIYWSLWTNGPQPIQSPWANGPQKIWNIPFVQEDRLWGSRKRGTKLVGDHLFMGDQIFGDHFSMMTEFDWDFLSRAHCTGS